MKKYQYQIIRYVHDHFTGEYVNVGVVAYSNEDRFLGSKTTSRYLRIKNMFPNANGKMVIQLLNKFNSRLKKVADELSGFFPPSSSLDQITSSIMIKDNNALQFSEVKRGIDIDIESALNDLYNSQVERYIFDRESGQSLLDDDVWRVKYREYFEKYGIDKRLKPHKVKVPKDIITFEKSWKNDIWHCYEPLSFFLKEKDSIKDKVYKWAGKLQGLQHSNEALHLTLLTSISGEHKDLMPFINEYLKVESVFLKVDIVTDDQAEKVAQEIFETMEKHDRNT
jgi:hypothetical protein